MKRYILSITGASGPAIGVRVLGELLKVAEVHLIISRQAFFILEEEAGIKWSAADASGVQGLLRGHFKSDRLFYWPEDDFTSPFSSGSFRTDGMLVVPCSMKTLAGISSGYGNNLTERAADVTLKEGRPLLISPRETPLSAIHLENMLRLARMGVKVVPPVMGFYQKPANLDDMIGFIAGKILDALGVEHNLYRRWGPRAPA